MTAEQIRKQRETLAAAEPFADLAEAAEAATIHVEKVGDLALQISRLLLQGTQPINAVADLRARILDDYNHQRERLHAAVDRVMRSALVDAAGAEQPEPPAPVQEKPR